MLFQLFAVSALLACVLAAIGVWSHRRLGVKVTAVAVTALFLPAVYVGYADLLSRPKPIALEWWRSEAPDATVLAFQLREGESIHLWLADAESGEPRGYVLPWSEPLARQLHGARREADAMGTRVNMRKPFERRRDDEEPLFYAEPQPALPPKQGPVDGGVEFRHSSRSHSGQGT